MEAMISENVRKYFERAINEKYNLVMSAEDLSKMDDCHRNMLAELLKPWDVTIMMVHRELLSHLKSIFFEVTQPGLTYQTFSQFVESRLAHKEDIWNTTALVSSALRSFSDVRIVDYYGIRAAGVPIQKVLFCEVMGVKSLCDFTYNNLGVMRNSESDHMNAKVDTAISGALAQFALQKGCRMPNHFQMADTFRGVLTIPFKTTRKLNYAFKNISAVDEYMLRKTYGNRIMYSNVNAGIANRRTITLEEVDVSALESDATWTHYFEKNVQKMEIEGYCAK
jgi:hypothetical protein